MFHFTIDKIKTIHCYNRMGWRVSLNQKLLQKLVGPNFMFC